MHAIAGSSLDQLAVTELATPSAKPGEVLVRVVAAAVNPADLKVVRNELSGRVLHARTKPLVVGFDFSGVVEACGSGVDDLGAGDEVFGFLPYSGSNRQGSFAERVAVPRGTVARKPAAVTHAIAAAAATPGASALQALRDKGSLKTGGRVLVIGAAGGVGSLAVGIAKRLGAKVTGVCSTSSVELVRQLGADEVIDRRITDPYTLAGPFDVIFDTSATYSYARMRGQLTPAGAFVTTLPSARWFAGKLLTALSRRSCHMFIVRSTTADLEQVATWLADGMRVPIDATFPVHAVGKALTKLASGEARGRISIEVDGHWSTT